MTKLWMAMIVTVIAGGYGMEAMGEGGNHEPADNLGHGTAKDFARLNQIPELLVGALLHTSGTVNTHGYTERFGLSGGSGGGDGIGNDGGDTLGGNAEAGGWGGEKI